MNDESLDNLFKDGLSGRDVNFNMDSWRKMEEMLPPETKGGYFSKRTAAMVVGLLFIASASVFVWSWNTSGDDILAENIVEVDQNTPTILDSIVNVPGKEHSVGALSADGDLGSGSENGREESLTQEGEMSQNNPLLVKTEDNNANGGGTITDSFGKTDRSGSDKSSYNKRNKRNRKSRGLGAIDSDDNGRLNEEKIAFSDNAFTKISGIGELSTMSLVAEDEDQTLFVDVSNGKLPSAERNAIGIIGGVSVNESLTGTSNGISGSEFFGVSYERYLNGGFSLKSNLLYASRNQVNTMKTFDVKSYDFGSRTEQTSVSAQRLMYIELPVMVNYGFRNHNIMAGGSFSYLVGGLQNETTTYTSLTEDTRYEDSKKWGYVEGFKPYDIALVAGYEYNFNSRLNMGLRLNYGLLDITDDQYFGTKSFDNNVQFRVYLTYSPFHF